MTPEEEQRLVQEELSALLAWAHQRDKTATLDDRVKKLIVKKIGDLTKEQVIYLTMQRTLIPYGVTPSAFVEQRADRLFLTEAEREGLGSPDLSDEHESEMMVWALGDIVSWLEDQPDGKHQYQHLIRVYVGSLREAKKAYTIAYGPLIAVKAINMVMSLARARKYIKANEKEQGG